MKKLFNWVMGIPLLCILLITGSAKQAVAQDVTVSYQSFYDNLSPYGQWIYDPQFGNVFVPNEEPGFRPYTRGHWVMTEYGNTWVSDDPYGWACYHYGRWTYNGYYGWVWIPGNEWAPAWVSWRYGHGYAGWAPLGPGYAVDGPYNCPLTWWVFIEPNYMYEPRWHEHWGGYESNRYYYRHTDYMNNYDEGGGHYGHYNYGPRAEVIEKYTHQPVVVYRTNNERTAGPSSVSSNTVNIYRPQVEKNSINSAKPQSVIQAPHPIVGKGEPAPRKVDNNAVPAFRQEHPMPVPNHQPQPPVHNPQPPMHNPQPEPQHNPTPQPPMHNPQPMPQHPTPEPPMHNPTPEPQRPMPQPPMHNPQPEPQRPTPQPPMHNPQPEPQRPTPQPPMHNPQPEPQRPTPQPPMHNPQPEPQRNGGGQPQMKQPQPHPQPQQNKSVPKRDEKKK